jgi:hypothetical protein
LGAKKEKEAIHNPKWKGLEVDETLDGGLAGLRRMRVFLSNQQSGGAGAGGA